MPQDGVKWLRTKAQSRFNEEIISLYLFIYSENVVSKENRVKPSKSISTWKEPFSEDHKIPFRLSYCIIVMYFSAFQCQFIIHAGLKRDPICQ